jgi:hypothetical protein
MKNRWPAFKKIVLMGFIAECILILLDMIILHPISLTGGFSFSLGRGIAISINILIAAGLFGIYLNPGWQAKAHLSLSRWLAIRSYRQFFYILLSGIFLLSLSICIIFLGFSSAFTSPAGLLVRTLFDYFQTLVYFSAFISLTLLINLSLNLFHHQLEDQEKTRTESLPLTDLFAITFAVIFQAGFMVLLLAIFYFIINRIPINTYIQYWYFDYLKNPPPINPAILLGIVVICLVVLMLIILRLQRGKMAALLIFGVILQFAFPLIEQGNLGRIAFRVGRLGSGAYINTVCQQADLADLFKNYVHYGPENGWIITKPPGFLTPYFLIKNLIKVISPSAVAASVNCHHAIRDFLLYATPWISMAGLLLLYLISKQLFPNKLAYLPGLVFILMPNMILFTGMPDQFLIPSVFMALVLLSIHTSQRESVLFAFLTGLWYAASINYSYALAGTLAFPLLLVGINYLLDRRQRKLSRTVVLGTIILLAAVAGIFLIQFLTRFDLVNGFNRAISSHQSFIKIRNPLEEIGKNLLVNNTEYLVWISPAVIMLFLTGLIAKFSKLPSQRMKLPSSNQAFIIASIFFYIVLNLAGQNRAEVARLWMFINALVALISPMFLQALKQKHRHIVLGLFIILQITLMFLLNQPFDTLFENVYQAGSHILSTTFLW